MADANLANDLDDFRLVKVGSLASSICRCVGAQYQVETRLADLIA